MELEEELSSAKKKAGSPEATEYPAYNWKKFWCYDPQSWYQGSGESAFTKNLELLNAKKEKLKQAITQRKAMNHFWLIAFSFTYAVIDWRYFLFFE